MGVVVYGCMGVWVYGDVHKQAGRQSRFHCLVYYM